jgi:bifunctional UDP-N-acetylglucosamine pyrophosphorylase/glucosamine-1-phosphate N-acetyltransferase
MAAGKGTRMKSRLPKVLHRLGGRPLALRVLDTAAALGARRVVVVTGHGAQEVEVALGAAAKDGAAELRFARQMPQLGTGHAVQQAAPLLPDDATVLVLSGDVPLIAPDTLRALVEACGGERLALLTVDLPDPAGYGRIVRSASGDVRAIVEHKDASDAQREIREIYSGIMAAPAGLLKAWLARLDNRNAQGEYYLTDASSASRPPTACRWWPTAPPMPRRSPASTARRSSRRWSAHSSRARPRR